MAYTHPPKEPIAIVGSGCRFPGDATSPSKLWELLHSPRDVSKRVPLSRFNPDGFYHPDGEHHGASNVTKSYFIEEDPRLFDSVFFNVTPREAEAIDPQQRVLLEVVYEAMESAGLTLQELKGSQTSAYVGLMTADYTDTQARDLENFSQYMATGTSRALISNRLSYFFDWKGPSMTVDTACSSSLTAIHLAVQSLRSGESQVACAAGANLLLGPDLFIGATSLHMISPSGKSQMWDQSADGYARGEGVGAVFLKTLSRALEDGDRIEALIRETGVNSDGRTKGITLPSPEAQAALIRQTYHNAGLDINRPEDRPQYFEAHGTGTQAGDPREASAISQSFFPPEQDNADKPTLLVGSIKTIIGHTEGCAGIAGVLKAVLAMRHKTIPPNQHLNKLNPSVEPSYKNLMIPTKPTKWPSVPSGHPLRASINSFGFGGTNTHAIVETYVPEIHDLGPWGKAISPSLPQTLSNTRDFTPLPLLLSANSEASLVALLEKYSQYLTGEDVSIHQLATTLSSRRTVLPVKASISALSKKDVLKAISDQLAKVADGSGVEIGTRSTPASTEHQNPRILGIFTGQGAQWPTMGKSLIVESALFRETIETLQQSLNELPDAPEWSIKDELMAPPEKSRLSQAALSQPLCTAVQVGLVNLLRRAGIVFSSVVGHSSGEIGAAYAAGIVSATDAIRIAYYRGVHAKLAAGSSGKKGSMIAVGFGIDEATGFCSSSKMSGRLAVAASNSPGSVTLSGDEDAVQEAKAILDQEGIFNRVLKVDTAYHSHHMKPCADPYVASLEACGIKINNADTGVTWVSSVYEDSRAMSYDMKDELEARYWRDNMVQTVRFSQAVGRAFEHDASFDFAIEVGPHPALRGPCLQTIKNKFGSELPYVGVLNRQKDDVVSFGAALGLAWVTLGPKAVNLKAYASAFNVHDASFANETTWGLPTYPWEHKTVLWRESRISKQLRSRSDGPHELLGKRTPDDTEYEPRWRNFFKLEEMPWLRDHRIQGQIVVPGAAYCTMALEAARVLGRGKNMKSIELIDLSILRPISIDESSEGTETLFSVRSDLDSNKGPTETIQAEFSLSASSIEDGVMRLVCKGHIRILLGEDEQDTFPMRLAEHDSELTTLNVEQFYEALGTLGLNYSGAFRGLRNAERCMNAASGLIAIDDKDGKSMPIHPTWLDVCFQTLFAALAAPNDGSMWSAFVPTTIRRIEFSPKADLSHGESSSVIVDGLLTNVTSASLGDLPTIQGDLHVYDSSTGRLAILIEQLTMASLLPGTPKNDRQLYLKTVWKQDVLSGADFEPLQPNEACKDDETIEACENVIRFYMSKIKAAGSFDKLAERMPGLAELIDEVAVDGKPPITRSQFVSLVDRFSDQIDMQLIQAIGERILNAAQRLARGESNAKTSISELISRWRTEGLGITRVHSHLMNTAKQISHRYPRIRILQVGQSSPNLIRSIHRELGPSFSSYTVVDSSPSFKEEIEAQLSLDDHRVSFKQFDIEKALESGHEFDQGSMDVVIVHKSFKRQRAALDALRSILRPGGFLLMMAATGSLLRFPFFSSLSPPAVGEHGASTARSRLRNLSPLRLHKILNDSGFSGIDSIGFDAAPEKHTFSVVVSQALDDGVAFLRSPMASSTASLNTSGKCLILGGSSLAVAKSVSKVTRKLSNVWDGEFIIVESLSELKEDQLRVVDHVLSVAELDHSILHGINPLEFSNLQLLWENTNTVLWVTQNSRSNNPYQSGTVGLGRSFLSENPQKSHQYLDLDLLEGNEALVAETFLRLAFSAQIRSDSAETSPLWAIETEIAIENGKILIPRLMPDVERNERINSQRRKVVTKVTVKDRIISLARSVSPVGQIAYYAKLATRVPEVLRHELSITVKYCSMSPIIPTRYGEGLYLCVGSTEKGVCLLALSTSNSSIVYVPEAYAIELDAQFSESIRQPAVFVQLMNEIRATVITNAMASDRTSLLLEPTNILSLAIERRADAVGKKFRVLTNHPGSGSKASINSINLVLPGWKRSLQSQLQVEAESLVHWDREGDGTHISAIQKVLPGIKTVPFGDLNTTNIVPQSILAESVKAVQDNPMSTEVLALDKAVVKASDLVSLQTFAEVVDWKRVTEIELTNQPIDASGLLSPNKTYLLVGLTGQMGHSICRWMVKNGARYIIAVSRNPNKDTSWREELQHLGAHISIEQADVTRKEDLLDLQGRILSSLPPIGGIANGAMVLSDGLFANMTYQEFQRVLKPKVDGSRNLDEIFFSNDLDFFIMFSSLSAVIGMPSQSNYAAANNFMVGLASQRRARNVAASVIDIGMIIGIGVIQRTEGNDANGVMEASLRKQNYMPVSERDLHHLLAEAILVGKSNDSPEIITGLDTYDAGSDSRPVWFNNPRFSHLVSNGTSSKTQESSQGEVQQSLKQRLSKAREQTEALDILQDGFTAYLASLVKLPVESINSSAPIIDFGIDSLVAVEIRTWIFAEAGYDVPVLQLLGGSSIAQICKDAVSTLSFEAKAESLAPKEKVPAPKVRNWDDLVRGNDSGGDASVSLSPTPSTMPVVSSDESRPISSSASDATDYVDARVSTPMPLTTEALSLGQSRLYFASQYLDDKTSFNCTTSYTFSGKLDVERLSKSLRIVTQRHESFRSSFYTDSQTGAAMQSIFEDSQFKLKVVPNANQTSDVAKVFESTSQYHFDLETGDTFVATLLSHGTSSHTIVFGYHHIIMDGVSWQLFLQDLAKFYNDPNTSQTTPTPTQYVGFVLKQKEELALGAYAERLAFFRDEFKAGIEPLPLFPMSKVSARKPLSEYKIREIVTHVDASTVAALKKAAQASRTTSFHFWLSTFQVLVCRLLDLQQVCIGIVDANRSNQAFGSTIGFLLEIMPVLFQVGDKKHFNELLLATRGKSYGALARTGVPIEEIVKACNIPASTTHTPLFQVVFNYRMGATRTSSMNGVDMKFLDYADAKTPFDLAVSVDEMDDGTAMLTFSVQDYLYDQEGTELLVNTYKHLLRTFSEDTSLTIADAPLYDPALTNQAIVLGTGAHVDLAPAPNDTLSKIINTWVEKDPDALAVKDMTGETMTYSEMSKRANDIAVALRKAGSRLESAICVILEPSVDTICSILAILRIGAVYVPLDVRSTDERLGDMLEESGATILLCHSETSGRAAQLTESNPQKFAFVDITGASQGAGERVDDVSTMDGRAMVLFTSGTTGKPKGIPLTNANIRSPILGVSEGIGLGREIVLQQSGQGFDAAIFQIFAALANGGSLIMGDNRGDPEELAAIMAREGVTMTLFIVSEMHTMFKYGQEFLDKCKSWRVALVGGEVVTTNLLDKFASLDQPNLRLFNAFGPTEASIISSIYEIPTKAIREGGFRVPIGTPIANYGTYIVDSHGNPVPVGLPGEMAITGPGVASGYLGRPDLTEVKFKPDVISSTSGKSLPGWDRLYLTGDKGRMLADGSIVILGRVDGDSQIKIRGMRVQLDNISNALVESSSGNIVDAATVVRGDDPASQFLVGYVVLAKERQVEKKETYLRQLLHKLDIPPHMRPTLLVALDSLPVTERGKLNTRKLATLPLPDVLIDEEETAMTETEKRLRDVWRQVLGEVSMSVSVGPATDFFSVGGNSMLLLRLRAEIKREFETDVPLAELFQTSTLGRLAARLAGESQVEVIDWDAETDPNEQVFSSALSMNSSAKPTNDNGLSILLTGATGYLGGGILRQLVERPDVARVHCAAVRVDAKGRSRTPNVESSKIIIHNGDLALPKLGMSEDQITKLFGDVDVVIHNGAEVSHMKSYHTLRAPNVASTLELAHMALLHNIPMHYISTGGVVRLSGLDSQTESSLSEYRPPFDGSDGYVASKWASEVLLEKINKRFGLPVWIHRPSNVTGEDVSALDIVHSVLSHSKTMRTVPDLSRSVGAFDFIHVDTISKQIAESAISSIEREHGDIVYVHQSGETVVPIDQLRTFLGHTADDPFNVVPMDEWVADAKKLGLNEIVASYLLASKGTIRMPLLERSGSEE